jgi:hypothetical protein
MRRARPSAVPEAGMRAFLRRTGALLLVFAAQLCAAQGLYVDAGSKLRFPGRLAEFQQSRVHQYDDPRLGVSVAYILDGLGKADIYVYDLGLPEIPPGIDSDVVKSAFASADNDIAYMHETGHYVDMEKLLPLGAVLDARGSGQKLYVRSYRFRLNREGAEPVMSWLVLTGFHNRFVKIRFSHGADAASEGERALVRLIDAFFEANRGD